ncbi:hypothetical protein CGZ91_12150 [Parenemella sanctibonifatiensis]|uniref:Heparinase II/III-like C-terminal domain-containing protein n=2 Tax=Parenemella sanctibonifatiensis TaxID=2016505 RepID=A0A255EBS5_9ACTN|nr:hypothetical protein CGZ91_12150 [Parenemella sanctibonifatiensis]
MHGSPDPIPHHISRRAVLQASAAGAVAAGIGTGTAHAMSPTVPSQATPAPNSAEIVFARDTAFVGDHLTVPVRAYGADGILIPREALEATWSVSDTALATIDEAGVLTVLAAGSVTVSVELTNAGGLTASAELALEELVTHKTRSTIHTDEKRANAATNIANLAWAAGMRDAAVADAKTWLDLGPEKLWDLVPSQQIPRSYAKRSVEKLGCLNCGEAVHAFGNYPYTADPINDPWKITCPNCSMRFPTNDFAAYYQGGLDENGLFDADVARSHNEQLIADGGTGNLVNVEAPDKGADWGVDAGPGVMLDDGARYTPVAYYAHWQLWHSGGVLIRAVGALSQAYLLTGDVAYASTGIALLDRVADIYPDLNLDDWTYPDGYLNSNGNSSRGKAIGSIWETSGVRNFLLAYDAFYPALADGTADPVDSAVLAMLDERSNLMDKTNPARIRRNIEDGLLRQILPAVKRGEIRGNNGMHQATLAAAAVILDHLPETKEMMDFNFATGAVTGQKVEGGNMASIFVDLIDRDGSGNEGAPEYNSLWLGTFSTAASYLDGYQLEGLEPYDLFEHAKFRKLYDSQYPLTMISAYTPTIGDSAKTGNPGTTVNASYMTTAFNRYQDPVHAQVLFDANGGTTRGLRGGIFDADPDGLADQVQAVIDELGPRIETSNMLTGFGFAALRTGVRPDNPVPTRVEISAVDLPIVEQDQPTKYFESNGTVQFEATGVGDSITFEFTLEQAAEEHFLIDMWTAATYGKYSVQIDGTEINPSLSFQGSGAQTKPVGPVTLEPGTHTLTLTVVDATGGPKAGLRALVFGVQDPSDADPGTERGAWLYFGRNTGHGHKDTLNLGYHAYRMDLLADLGYPRYANSIDMHRKSLVMNTIAHNTVVVDKLRQDSQVVAKPLLFSQSDWAQVIDVDASTAYAKASEYRRTTFLINTGENSSYLVDLFRVTGGSEHLFSFHAQESEAVESSAELTPQRDAAGEYVGSYAGPDVPYDDEVDDPTGQSYFFSVDRSAAAVDSPTITWSQVRDTWNVLGAGAHAPTDVSVRARMLTSFDEVALADTEPPNNKPGNPERVRYLLAKRAAEKSLFTSVIEAYQGSETVTGAIPVEVTLADGTAAAEHEVRAVQVSLADGRTDLVVHALNADQTYRVGGRTFRGSAGVLRTGGEAEEVFVAGGSEFGPAYAQLPALTGTVDSFTEELKWENELRVSFDAHQAFRLTADDLVGRYLVAEHTGDRNAVYRIHAVRGWSEAGCVLDIDSQSPIQAYLDANDLDQGFRYDLVAGASFRIPLTATSATDGEAQLRAAVSHLDAAGELAPPAKAQLPKIIDEAATADSATRRQTQLRRFTAQLELRPVRQALSDAGYTLLKATAEGWAKQA